MEDPSLRPKLVDLPIYDQQQAAAIGYRVESLRDQWLFRREGFSTLGLAAYLDVAGSDDPARDYHGRLHEQNMLLRNHFSEVLEDVGFALSRHLDSSVRLDNEVAHPGFHIFEGPSIAVSFHPCLHFDLQHRALQWPFDVAEEDGLLSFTLTLKLPRLGGGLHYWDLTEPELTQLNYQLGVTLEQLAKTPPSFHRYSPGVMAVQMVPVLHRIAPIAERFPSDQRITLQGHAVRDGNTWVLYW